VKELVPNNALWLNNNPSSMTICCCCKQKKQKWMKVNLWYYKLLISSQISYYVW